MSDAGLFPASAVGGIDLAHPDTDRLGYDPDDMLRTAYLSDEVPVPRYRWTLHRRFRAGQILAFIMLNPSIASHLIDDPTVVKCLGFASRLGFGAIDVVNLFPWRATKPADMWAARDAGENITGGRKGDQFIVDALDRAARLDTLILAAWGANAAKAADRITWLSGLPGADRLHALSITKDGHPGHPLMLPYSCQPIPWKAPV